LGRAHRSALRHKRSSGSPFCGIAVSERCPNGGNSPALFDHIIGACKQCVWQGAANSWHPYPFQEECSGSRWRALLRRKEAAN